MTSVNEAPSSADTLRRAYRTMGRLQRRVSELEEAERRHAEPIAIIGLACRFPGGAVDAETYWGVLRDGIDAVGEVPPDRWDADAFYSKEPRRPGRMNTRWGGFLDRIDEFDHEFFGISRREAVAMDPQQRLSLEVAWEALENAGQAPGELAGSRTGVFMGVCSNDFGTETFRLPRDITAYASTGTAHSMVTGRISYTLDLRGPSEAIDTACSSSLVAVHHACQGLRSGECDLALGGGVNAVISPLPNIAFSQFPGMVSEDGRCKAFDAAANGYVRGEGCGVVVLKRLSDAVRDGDRVLAVIRGGAVNQDGRSSGITAPNGDAQRDVLRRALAASGVGPHEVSYIEAHGTGTRLGDPIEVDALAEVYGRPDGTPVYLGSSKTNIGHAEAAAGIAALIKVVLSLGRGAIPRNVHFERLNPHLSFAGTTFAVPAELTDWPVAAGRRIAGVSAFGFSGTNAHLIVAEGPSRAEPAAAGEIGEPAAGRHRPRSLLALSAKSQTALTELARRYQERLGGDGPETVEDLCYSANTGRTHFRHRLAVEGATRQQIADRLGDFVRGGPDHEVAVGEAGDSDVVFLFTGQGPQRAGMARGLYEAQPVFREVIDRCDELLRPMLQVPLLAVLHPDLLDPGDPGSDLVNVTTYAQPALFSVEYAMAQMWRSWGVEPVAVLGHSFGEYVAACVAGAMSLEDALTLVVERARLMNTLADRGAMAAVFAPELDVAMEVADHEGLVSIAAVNGPANIVISGDREAVASLCASFERLGVETKRLHITTSSHSPLIEPILEPLRRAAERVRFSPPRIPLVSNVDGALWPWDKAPDADYWCRHAREPVRFAAGIGTLLAGGYRTFVELGPAPILLGLIKDGLPGGRDALLAPSLRSQHDDWEVLLSTVALLYAHGTDIDWRGFDRGWPRAKVPVPTYPFDRTRCGPPPRRRTADEPSPSEYDDAAPGDTELSGDTELPGDTELSSDTELPGEGELPGFEDDELLYRLAWRPAEPAPASAAPDVPRTWLVLADDGEVGDQVTASLVDRGARVVRVVRAAEYRFDGTASAGVRLADRADLVRLVDDLGLDVGEELQVVHLWSLTGAATEPDSVEAALRAQNAGCMSAVRVVQALVEARSTMPTRLWLVTRGAVQPTEPGTTPLAVGQATLWGLGRSLQQEAAAVWGGLIDLDPAAEPAAVAASLLAELEAADHRAEDQIALREGRRYVARLVHTRLPQAPPRPAVLRREGSYLITGGFGGLGLEVARSLARRGARRLILVGRTPVPPREQWAGLDPAGEPGRRVAAVRELESLGASVTVESFDVSDEAAARAFLERHERECRPAILGVVHAAGAGDVAPLTDLEPDDLEWCLRPKAMGAWVLDRLFADRPLDFFVLFSSTSSILSSPFVAAYAAANAFLDALALQRRNAGRPGLSINWGIWERTGMAARGAQATPGHSRGMGVLRPDQALRVLHRLLGHDLPGHDEAQVAVVPVDWSEWGHRYQAVSLSALLSELLDAPAGAPAAAATAAPGRRLPARADLLALPAQQRADALATRLLLATAVTLRSEPSAVGLDRPLIELGLDSLMAVELRNELEGRLGVSLPISVFLRGATVQALAERIVDALPDDAPTGDAPTGDAAAADPATGDTPAGDAAAGPDGAVAGATTAIRRVRRVQDLASDLLAQLEQTPAGEAGTGTDGEW